MAAAVSGSVSERLNLSKYALAYDDLILQDLPVAGLQKQGVDCQRYLGDVLSYLRSLISGETCSTADLSTAY